MSTRAPKSQFARWLVAGLLISASSTLGQQSNLPDLAQLKLAAEAGDPVAQFEYGHRIWASNTAEQFSWFQRSAEQGYAPAEDAVGAHFDSAMIFEPKKKLIATKEAVRWTSLAAFQGFPRAQLRLAIYYERGTGLPKDPVTAYMWNQLAYDNPNSNSGERTVALMQRDHVIANTSSDNIREGLRRAAEFKYPAPGSLNPVEADLLLSQLQLVGIFHQNGQIIAAVNNVRFRPGETMDVKVEDHRIKLTCVAIEGNSARFKIAGVNSELTLVLKH